MLLNLLQTLLPIIMFVGGPCPELESPTRRPADPAQSAAAESPAAVPQAAAEASAKTYLVTCRLTETIHGRPQVLSSPKLMVTEGRPAKMQVAQQTPVVVAKRRVEVLTSGVEIDLTVFAEQPGKARVDLAIDVSQAAVSDTAADGQQSAQVRSQGLRVIRSIPLGTRVSLPVAGSNEKPTHHLELVVSETLE